MKISQVNNSISTQGVKFRLPVKKCWLSYDSERGAIYRHKVNYMKVYKNPDAGALYKKALKANDIKEMASLFDQMGEYELIDMDKESFLGKMKHKFCEMFINTFLFSNF